VAIDATTLSNLIAQIYEAGLGVRSWYTVVTDVAKAFGEQGGILYEFDARLRQSQVLGSTPVDPAMIAQYEQYYGSVDAFHHRVVHEPTLEINATHNLIRDSELERSEFYNDYFRHLDFFYAMGTIVRRNAGKTAVFGVQRSKRRGHFDAREFKSMEILAHHVDRSLEIAERMQYASRPSLDSANAGFVLLDASGKAVFATTTAQRLLEMAGIGFEAGLLTGTGAIGRRLSLLLHRLVQGGETAKAAGDHLDIDLPSGARLSVLAISADAALPMPGIGRLACLMVELHAGPRDRAAVLRLRYRLTTAEAALAVALAEGQTLRDIASAKDISINTLRVQLQAIFAKTACHRQSDLVRLVLRLPAG
jgi:DNA-binding CsgD family transcriptional regulator